MRRILSRKALVLLGVVTLLFGVLGVFAFPRVHARAASSNDGLSVEGSWIVTVYAPDLTVAARSFYTFAPDGRLTESDANDQVAQLRASPGYGVWVRTGDHTFAFQVVKFLLDPQGNALGYLKFQLPTNRLAVSGTTFSGSGGSFEGITFDGQVLFSGGAGTLQGTRISATGK
jgi:hypothetical protein